MGRNTLFCCLLLFFLVPVACQEVAQPLQDVGAVRFFRRLRRSFREAVASMRDNINRVFSRPALVVAPAVVTGHRYVAFGDSFAAGAGSGGGTYRPHSSDYDRCCYRKRNAYPSLLMTKLGVSSFRFHACSGATAMSGPNSVLHQLRPYYAGRDNDNRRVSFVTVTVGGNDMGFSRIIRSCMFTYFGARRRCRKQIRTANSLLSSKVAGDVRMLDGILRETFPNALVVFTGYPLPYPYGRSRIGNNNNNRLCRSREFRHSMNDLCVALNKAIRSNVRNFVPISFSGREMCRPNTPSWINNGINTTVRRSRISKRGAKKCSTTRRIYSVIGGFYHPTRYGQLQYAREIERWYKKNHGGY